jgi:RNA polymerase sigma-70 factor (ECF subfamily)
MYRVPNTQSFPLDPLRLGAERGRLVRLCARQVGNAQVAEDLAQETLLIAWQRHHTLRDGDLWQAWLNGIARNVCLRYLRKIGQEKERLVSANGENAATTYEMIPDNSLPPLDELLEHDDLSRLLDRALNRLPNNTQDLLVDRYLRNMPIEEIAERRGVREDTATVQLHRSRQALKRILTDSEMRTDTAALGLIDPQESFWQETRLWCPDCGMHRLEGLMCYYNKSDRPSQIACSTCGTTGNCNCSSDERGGSLTFGLRCPGCSLPSAGPGSQSFPLVHMNNARMLVGIKGFKPALNRVNRWWNDRSQRLIQEGYTRCLHCGHSPVPVSTIAGTEFPWPTYHGKVGLFTHCCRCGSATAIEAHEIARQSDAGQTFWQANPRFRTVAPVIVPSNDGRLLVTRLESVGSNRAIEIALHEQTMQIARIVRVGA